MPFVTKQPACNVLYELIARTIEAVKELDSLQAERFQRKIRFAALHEPNGAAGDSGIASAPPDEVSTGEESAVRTADMRVMSNKLRCLTEFIVLTDCIAVDSVCVLLW